MNHSGPISCVASHGAYVATAGYDNRVILSCFVRKTSPFRAGM